MINQLAACGVWTTIYRIGQIHINAFRPGGISKGKAMTPEQLKKLAEIAGLKQPFKDVGGNDYWFKGVYFSTLKGWVPHVKIEQAMMVAEKVTADMFELTLEKGIWFATFYFNLDADNQTEVECEKSTPSEAICAAALAIGDGK